METYKSETLEHLGLVAGMFDELGIGELVDAVVPQDLEQRKISVGQALKAMVLNGLGFANRRLYLTTRFFQNKPTGRLLGEGVEPEHLNDDALGKALDDLYAYGVSELYMKIAAKAAVRLGISPKVGHMDTTSFHVDGAYNSDDPPDEDSRLIHITKGYSRDHRPDLHQVVLKLITENQASLPMMMQPLSGNSSDKATFEHSVHSHIAQLKAAHGLSLMVSDSAGYTRASLEAYQQQGVNWVMSVPSTLKEAKQQLADLDIATMQGLAEGYRYTPVKSHYAGVFQRWLLIYSEQARERAEKSAARELLRQSEHEHKAFERLCRARFNCPEDAERALASYRKSLKVLTVHEHEVVPHKHFGHAGRPRKDAVPSISYQLSGAVAAAISQREALIVQRSCFILATNNLDEDALSDGEILQDYKGQAHVERGFRFLKDPMFLAATLFLKKIERIMALLMVMTVCLLVYAALEHRIRKALKQHAAFVPDQKGKPTHRPTARWVFELFLDVHLLSITIGADTLRTLVLNLQQELQALLVLLGKPYEQLYS